MNDREIELVEDHKKLFILYQNLDKMIYYPTVLIQQKLEKGESLTEEDTALYYVLKLSAEILKSYMQEKGIPVFSDIFLKYRHWPNRSENLTHADFLEGLFKLMKLYELRDDERLKTLTDLDTLGTDGTHPLEDYLCGIYHNATVYDGAYAEVERLKRISSEEEYFKAHPPMETGEYFKFI